jgi:hypothetical protein
VARRAVSRHGQVLAARDKGIAGWFCGARRDRIESMRQEKKQHRANQDDACERRETITNTIASH